ncbi:hypothetical protein B0A55_13700, partial [Friedmanniomyces simplex]
MASKALARPLVSLSNAIGSNRGFATASKSQAQLLRAEPRRAAAVQIPRQRVQQAFRRTYAEVSPETQRVIKKRSWGFFRWTWRLAYLSAIGGTLYMGYGIYQGRTPAE